MELRSEFRLKTHTLFITVNLLDRFLATKPVVSRQKLQLVGCACMLIASKYEEILTPEVKDFVVSSVKQPTSSNHDTVSLTQSPLVLIVSSVQYICDKAYTAEQVIQMESLILSTLQFNISTASAWRFAQRFLMVLLWCSVLFYLCVFAFASAIR